jgi:hypothetical protein
MSRQLGHPDPADLASLRAGLIGARRGERLSAHAARCPRCARVCTELDAVSGVLATTPVPPFPESAEQRVLAALSLESVSRMRQPGPHPGPASQRHRRGAVRSRGPQASPLSSSRRPSSRSARRRLAAAVPRTLGIPQILLPAVAGLLVLGAGAGYLMDAWSETPSAAQEPRAARMVEFLVANSGTKYRKATLRVQVREMLAARATMPVEPVQPGLPSWTVPSHGPGAAIRASARPTTERLPPQDEPAAATPSQALVGCVMHLTGHVPPVLVDRASYQSEPVYVIAVPDRAWVVGVGCTAADPMIITSVQLTTTS